MEPDLTASLIEQHACVRREIGKREAVYPKLVREGRMRHAVAEREIVLMKAVADTLAGLINAARIADAFTEDLFGKESGS